MTISKKLYLTIAGTILILLLAGAVKILGINSIKDDFENFLKNVTTSRVLVTEISEDLNYISRCTRDIMLGNAYEKNIKKIEDRKREIEGAFDKLYELTSQGDLRDLIQKSKSSTMVFIKDGYEKMLLLRDTDMSREVLDKVYKSYKKDATPLANESRKYFSQIQENISAGYDKGVEDIGNEVIVLEYKVVGETVFIFLFIVIVLLVMRRDIVSSIKKLKEAIGDIVLKKVHADESLEVSNDEFGEIQTILNDYIIQIEEDKILNNQLIQDVKKVVSRVTEGDLSSRVHLDTHDESLQELKANMNQMLDTLEDHVGSNITFINEVLGMFASSDYTKKVSGGKGNITLGINRVGEVITEMLNSNQSISIELEDLAEQLKEKVSSLTQSSNNQAANLEEVTAAIEEIAGNLRNSSKNAEELLENSNRMQEMALSGEESIARMTGLISQINDQQKNITNAIAVIDQIAFQTNILSLNAAVEAATAGEHGKGFAVVATEVRNLAAKSAEAATDIKDLVKNGTDLINESTLLSDEVKESFEKLLETIKDTTNASSSINNDTQDQMTSMSQIASTMNTLDTATQNNAILAQDTNELAKNTEMLARTIKDEIDKNVFDGKVSQSDRGEDEEV